MSVYSVRKSMIPLAKKVILALSKEKILDDKNLKLVRNKVTKTNGGVLPKNLELVEAYRELVEDGEIKHNPQILKAIQKRKIRTLSGIANITVLTKNFGCPGKCIFCPTEKGMPKSYLSNEPAMMRAVLNQFDPYRQVKTRLRGLVAQGHDITKIDIRIAGGTWSAIPEQYREEFIKGVFLALNEGPDDNSQFPMTNCQLSELIKENETAKCRCVGLWVETRPDWVTEKELKKLREYGVTGIEMGIQTTDDKINEFSNRGHGLKESMQATKMCRDIGLKICHHIMPNLPKADIKSDIKTGIELFTNENLRPDYLKIYPMMVTPFSELSEMLKKNPDLHKAYTDDELIKVLAEIKSHVPEYCRIIRVIRDFPAESIIFGSKKSNLRQIMQKMGMECRCVRCREIQDSRFKIQDLRLKVQDYKANGGEEFFISIEEPSLDKIIGLCRLRSPGKDANVIFDELKGAAIIRELHVYGRQESLIENSVKSESQHRGFGRQLMEKAEEIAKKAGYKKIAVISAIGTREYYRKLGYELEGTYMTKELR